uniref:Uncharacterized protein n=1 Tax=Heterorhabditis bacteriophora TaxID=37862 RepID=A0A1I7WGY3_HETBA
MHVLFKQINKNVIIKYKLVLLNTNFMTRHYAKNLYISYCNDVTIFKEALPIGRKTSNFLIVYSNISLILNKLSLGVISHNEIIILLVLPILPSYVLLKL